MVDTRTGAAYELGGSIVVTGAAGGVGRQVAHRIAERGAKVLAVDVSEAGLDEVLVGLNGDGHRAMVVDLSSVDGVDALLEAIVQTPDLAGMAHVAAALRRRHSLEEITLDDWTYQVDTNLRATFFLNRAVGLQLVAADRSGSIVNVVSQSWWTGGFGGSVVYAATKGGVVSMSRGLARQWGPHHVRVNTIAPGFIDTAMMRSGLTEEQLDESVAAVPMGRLGEPGEVADAITFLLGSQASYITGATLSVTGGQLMY